MPIDKVLLERIRINDAALKEVQLSGSSDSDMQELAPALEKNSTIVVLNLGGHVDSGITGKGAKLLANALMRAPLQLEALFLHHNPLGDEGAEAIATIIHKWPKLNRLGLGRCKIGEKGAQALVTALPLADNLSYLGLYGNEFGDSASIQLAKLITKFKHLSTLEFNSQGGGEKVARAFLQALQTSDLNRPFLKFTIGNSYIISEKTRSLIDDKVNPNRKKQINQSLSTNPQVTEQKEIKTTQSIEETNSLVDLEKWEKLNTPLLQTAIICNVQEVERLLNAGADIEARSAMGTALLLCSYDFKHTPEKAVATAKLLLARGASVDPRSPSDTSPLCQAVVKDNVTLVKLLLDNNANVNATSMQGWTILHWAKSEIVVRLLLSKGAKVDAGNMHGETPLLHVLKITLDDRRVGVARSLIEAKANVNIKDKNTGDAPLHLVVKNKNSNNELLKLLLGAGADYEATNNNGQTPATLARELGKNDIADFIEKEGKLVKDLKAPNKQPSQNVAAIEFSATMQSLDSTKNKKAIEKSQLERIRINDPTLRKVYFNFITDADITELASALENNSIINVFNLSGAHGYGITGKGARILADALRRAPFELEALFLHFNPLGDEGAEAIATVIHKWPKLSRLGLGGCKIGEKGGQALIAALTHVANLSYLGLSGNNFGESVSILLAKLVTNFNYLSKLEFYNNPENENILQAFLQATALARKLGKNNIANAIEQYWKEKPKTPISSFSQNVIVVAPATMQSQEIKKEEKTTSVNGTQSTKQQDNRANTVPLTAVDATALAQIGLLPVLTQQVAMLRNKTEYFDPEIFQTIKENAGTLTDFLHGKREEDKLHQLILEDKIALTYYSTASILLCGTHRACEGIFSGYENNGKKYTSDHVIAALDAMSSIPVVGFVAKLISALLTANNFKERNWEVMRLAFFFVAAKKPEDFLRQFARVLTFARKKTNQQPAAAISNGLLERLKKEINAFQDLMMADGRSNPVMVRARKDWEIIIIAILDGTLVAPPAQEPMLRICVGREETIRVLQVTKELTAPVLTSLPAVSPSELKDVTQSQTDIASVALVRTENASTVWPKQPNDPSAQLLTEFMLFKDAQAKKLAEMEKELEKQRIETKQATEHAAKLEAELKRQAEERERAERKLDSLHKKVSELTPDEAPVSGAGGLVQSQLSRNVGTHPLGSSHTQVVADVAKLDQRLRKVAGHVQQQGESIHQLQRQADSNPAKKTMVKKPTAVEQPKRDNCCVM